MSTAGEHLPPLVEGGALGLEEDVPLLQQAEAALLVGDVVPTPHLAPSFFEKVQIGRSGGPEF